MRNERCEAAVKQQGGGEAAAWKALGAVESELGPLVGIVHDPDNPIHRALEAAMAALNQRDTAPPSAPVGVGERQALANVPFGWVKDAPSGIRSTLDFTTLPGVAEGWRVEGYRVVTLYSLPYLRQQPSAVDEVKIDMALAERVMDALGRFTGDEGWSAADMMTADAFGAALATQHQEPTT